MDYFSTAKTNMIKSQLLPNKIGGGPLIKAMEETPRHIFTKEEHQTIAYFDGKLDLGNGRYILPPMVFAKMVDALSLHSSAKLLDIACGTGYSSAILSRLCHKIVAIESQNNLAAKANQNLNLLGINNVIIISSQLKLGQEDNAPYDAILINGAVKEVPESLLSQLNNNGKLVTLISKSLGFGHIALYSKENGQIKVSNIFDVSLPVIEDF